MAKQEEKGIQSKIEDMLRIKGWYVIRTHGNMYQAGLPDNFACHSKYGQRWIEIKKTWPATFTDAQHDVFPKLCANGSGVWVLIDATEDEYQKLFKRPNWYTYIRI